MVSEEEFVVVAMIAMFFAFTTLMLLLRGRGLKKRLRREEERSLHLTRALAPAASVVAAPALAQERPARDEELVELRKRVQVLERITVEKEHSLAREIEELRVR